MNTKREDNLIFETYVQQEGIASTIGHVALDLAGLVPVYGEIADGANALWYASKGEYLNATFSLISLIPVLGDAVGKGGKVAIYAAKGAKAAKGVKGGRAAAKGLVKGTQALRKGTAAVSPHIIKVQKAIKANKQVIDGVFQKASENEKLAPHVKGMQDALGAFMGEGGAQKPVTPSAVTGAVPATPMPGQAQPQGPPPGATPATGLGM